MARNHEGTCSEKMPASFQFVFADAIGQEAELADAHQSGRQNMQQEAAQELYAIEGHELGAGAVGVILPVETDVAVFERAQAMVRDGQHDACSAPDTSARGGDRRKEMR